MTIEKAHPSGAYIISEFVGEGAGEYLFTRTYYGYTKREAIKRFNEAKREAK